MNSESPWFSAARMLPTTSAVARDLASIGMSRRAQRKHLRMSLVEEPMAKLRPLPKGRLHLPQAEGFNVRCVSPSPRCVKSGVE